VDRLLSGLLQHAGAGRSSGQGQVELVSDLNANQWFVITAKRIPGKSYRWYVCEDVGCRQAA
jgi:hypothetical protein